MSTTENDNWEEKLRKLEEISSETSKAINAAGCLSNYVDSEDYLKILIEQNHCIIDLLQIMCGGNNNEAVRWAGRRYHRSINEVKSNKKD